VAVVVAVVVVVVVAVAVVVAVTVAVCGMGLPEKRDFLSPTQVVTSCAPCIRTIGLQRLCLARWILTVLWYWV
jgi:hypothetical protein